MAAESGGHADLALDAARHMTLGELGPLEYVVGTAPDVRDSLQLLARYFPLLYEGAQARLEEGSEVARLALSGDAPVSRIMGDFLVIAVWLCLERWLPLGRGGPRQIFFAHPPPIDRGAYQQLFPDSRLVFAAQEYAIEVDASWLSRKNPKADARLHTLVKEYADRLLKELPREESLTERVRRSIIETMPDGSVSAERVALMLCMSRRTLSRQLSTEGTSFRTLLEDERQRFAKHYLESSDLGAADIAFMLGFSQSAAFVRAFRRWTGCAPGEYRRRVRT